LWRRDNAAATFDHDSTWALVWPGREDGGCPFWIPDRGGSGGDGLCGLGLRGDAGSVAIVRGVEGVDPRAQLGKADGPVTTGAELAAPP
jgi:hypothetical protein